MDYNPFKLCCNTFNTLVARNLRHLLRFSTFWTRMIPLLGVPSFSPEMISSSFISILPSARSVNRSRISIRAWKKKPTTIMTPLHGSTCQRHRPDGTGVTRQRGEQVDRRMFPFTCKVWVSMKLMKGIQRKLKDKDVQSCLWSQKNTNTKIIN